MTSSPISTYAHLMVKQQIHHRHILRSTCLRERSLVLPALDIRICSSLQQHLRSPHPSLHQRGAQQGATPLQVYQVQVDSRYRNQIGHCQVVQELRRTEEGRATVDRGGVDVCPLGDQVGGDGRPPPHACVVQTGISVKVLQHTPCTDIVKIYSYIYLYIYLYRNVRLTLRFTSAPLSTSMRTNCSRWAGPPGRIQSKEDTTPSGWTAIGVPFGFKPF